MRYLLGMDAGTTALKTVLFNRNGKALARAIKEYALETPQPGIVELDPVVYWRAAKECIRKVIHDSKVPPDEIRGITITSQGETLIILDRKGRALRKAIVWLDSRAREESRVFEEEFGRKRIFRISGQPQVPSFSWPAIMLWLRQREPCVVKQAARYLLVGEYLTYKFCGEFVGSPSVRASTCVYDQINKKWDKKILRFSGLESSQLPQMLESGRVIGRISRRVANETGLSSRTWVVNGALDQHCAAIGVGNIRKGIISESTGGALAIVATVKKPILDPARKIPLWHHGMENTYSLLPWGNTAGMCLKWFRDEFCSGDSYGQMDREADNVPPGAEGLVMLPFLAGGAACPEFNPDARGVFYGITLAHRKPHFIRAILESVAFMLRKNIEEIERLGPKVKEVRSTGGGARSKFWSQVKADVCRRPILTFREEESACLGSAILAAVATNEYANIKEAVNKMVTMKRRFLPRRGNFPAYERVYKLYRDLYERLEGLFHRGNE